MMSKNMVIIPPKLSLCKFNYSDKTFSLQACTTYKRTIYICASHKRIYILRSYATSVYYTNVIRLIAIFHSELFAYKGMDFLSLFRCCSPPCAYRPDGL